MLIYSRNYMSDDLVKWLLLRVPANHHDDNDDDGRDYCEGPAI